MKITLVTTCEGYEALYVDGKLKTESEYLSAEEVLDALGLDYNHEEDIEFPRENEFPENLEDLYPKEVTPHVEKAILHYADDKSDKVYKVYINEADSYYTVDFEYGKRGGTMNSGTKTEDTISFTEAKALFDKVVNEKIRKGYILIDQE